MLDIENILIYNGIDHLTKVQSGRHKPLYSFRTVRRFLWQVEKIDGAPLEEQPIIYRLELKTKSGVVFLIDFMSDRRMWEFLHAHSTLVGVPCQLKYYDRLPNGADIPVEFNYIVDPKDKDKFPWK